MRSDEAKTKEGCSGLQTRKLNSLAFNKVNFDFVNQFLTPTFPPTKATAYDHREVHKNSRFVEPSEAGYAYILHVL